jgi:hypothetical protein
MKEDKEQTAVLMQAQIIKDAQWLLENGYEEELKNVYSCLGYTLMDHSITKREKDEKN